ncbi:MAG: aminoacyl-tRNA hydrolase [Sphaerochaetaceae bacterium]|nr:aminoacyl-tRNA hydrolase [Sphaerochaetaceae bacterium]
MRLVIGLGNPGEKYSHTRHNAGFDATDRLAAFFQVSLKKRCLRLYRYAKVPGGQVIQPLTYMNNSGKIIKYFKNSIENVSDIAVVCDNMDLAVGGLRIRKGGGSSGQKGLNSISEALGSPDFIRIYIGVGRPAEGVEVVDHVLQVETDPEKAKVYSEALELASKALVRFLEGATVEELQRDFNRKGIL